MKRLLNFKIFFAAILIVLINSCKVGPKYQEPDFQAPEGYLYGTNEADSLGDIKWWSLFQDPIIDSLVEKAIYNNQDLRIAIENVYQAGLFAGIQKVEYWPKLNYSVGANRGNNVNFVLFQDIEAYNALGSLSWEIDLWGRIRNLNEAALAQFLLSQNGLKSVRLTIASTVVSNYLLYKEFETSYLISQQTLALRDSSERLVRARFEKGYAPEIDLNQAEVQRAIAESSVHRYDRLRKQAQNNLSLLIGELPKTIDVSLDTLILPPSIPEGIPSTLLRRRPDILQAEQAIKAQNAQVGVAVANRFPTFSITGALGIGSTDLSSILSNGLGWNAAAGVAGPLLNYGQNKKRVQIEESVLQQRYLEYEKTTINAFKEVEDALIGISTYKSEMDARADHVRAAVNAQYLSGERYDKGVTSYLEYLESQRQAFEAQLAYVTARRLLFDSYVQLYKALGGGWLTTDQPNP